MNNCNAEQKCWEHWQGWHARVTQRDLALAADYIFLRADEAKRKGQMGNLSVSFPEKLEEACTLYDSLVRRQWCEMVRKPFVFKIPEALIQPVPLSLKTALDLI